MNTNTLASKTTLRMAVFVALLCGASSTARAQREEPAAATPSVDVVPPVEGSAAPSTQPAPAGDDSARSFDRRRMDGFGPRSDNWRRPPMDIEEEPSPEEWEDVARFTKQYSPKRWDAFTQLPEDRRDRVRRFMYWRYRQVKQLEEADPEIFDLHVKRLAIEDEIFPLAWVIRRADGDETKEVTDAREALRKHVVALVEIGLKERSARLERMKRRHRAEEEQLSLDRAHQAELVEQRMDEILRGRGGGPWPGGGGGDGPRRPFVGGPEGRAGEPIGGPRPPEGGTP